MKKVAAFFPDEFADAVKCVMRDAKFANAYLPVTGLAVRAIILRRRKLEKYSRRLR